MDVKNLGLEELSVAETKEVNGGIGLLGCVAIGMVVTYLVAETLSYYTLGNNSM